MISTSGSNKGIARKKKALDLYLERKNFNSSLIETSLLMLGTRLNQSFLIGLLIQDYIRRALSNIS